MYRRTPPSSSRARSSRSTRSARGSTKRRRGAGKAGGFADQLRRAAESGPTRKWVKVLRAPAPHIRFVVEKWIPLNDLTEEEREDYEREQIEERSGREQQLQLSNEGVEVAPEAGLEGGQSKPTDKAANQIPLTPGKKSMSVDVTQHSPEAKTESLETQNSLELPPSKRIRLDDPAGATEIGSVDPVPNSINGVTAGFSAPTGP